MIQHRDEETFNPKIPTGTIELEAHKIDILGKVYRDLPFEIATSKEIREDVRLKYRYLDMRNRKVKDNILFRSKVIRFLREKMEDMGFVVEASHHEKAPSQHEVDFRYDEALTTADNIMTFKLAVKTIAKHHGLHATFMPKPRKEFCGSGMHINMSLRKDGRNIFDDPNGENGLSKEAYYFMGGVMKHVKGICAVTNPLVNSYKRLKPGFEAPVYVAWSTLGANTLIRVPNMRGEHTRIELRSPDPAANPYLAFAACLMAGLDGIRNQIEPPAEVQDNINILSEDEAQARGLEKLPTDLLDACMEMKKDTLLKDLVGDRVFDQYYESKIAAWKEYDSQVTNWEIESYLYKF